MSESLPSPVSPLRVEHGNRIAKQIEDINSAISCAKRLRDLSDSSAAACEATNLIAQLATIRATAYSLQSDVGALRLTGQAEWAAAQPLALPELHAPLPADQDRRRAAANDHD